MQPRDFRKRVISYNNAFAGVYDLTEFFRRGTREAMVRVSGCKAGDHVLDICTGTGEFALTFARHGIHTVAVDLARDMLRIGNQKSSFDHLDFLETDAIRLPFQNKSFNVVTVSLAMHHMPEIVQIEVLKEMTRLASHKVIMLEWHTPRERHWKILKGLLIRVMDVSEHLQDWMHQDFPSTCRIAGLKVDQEEVLTLGFHRLTVCRPI